MRVKLSVGLISVLLAFGSVGCSSDDDVASPSPAAGGLSGTGGGATGGGGGTGGDVGTGGTGGDAVPVSPTSDGTIYSLQVGDVVFAADAAVGARITTFGFVGANLLTGPSLSPNNYGSTFWPAPQSWGWPPPAPIDRDPYAGQIVGTEILLQGAPDPTTGISVEKRFSADSSGWFTLSFTMTNTSSVQQTWAPWQVTRVHQAGYSFFPTGTGQQEGITGVVPVGAETWFDAASGVQDEKLYADGAQGWLAHATGSFLFVKRFPDLPAGTAAAGEAEIEIYVGAGYVELEVQGSVFDLAPGQSAPWTIQWKVVPTAAPVPAGLENVDTAGLVARAVEVAME